MKKFACLVLALVLCLSMLCAVAEDTAETQSPVCEVTVMPECMATAPADEAVVAAIRSGEMADELAAAFGETDKAFGPYEVFMLSAAEGTEGELTVVFTTPTAFTADQKVVVALKLAEGMVGYPAAAEGNTVTVTFDANAIAQMVQAPVLCVIMATVAE